MGAEPLLVQLPPTLSAAVAGSVQGGDEAAEIEVGKGCQKQIPYVETGGQNEKEVAEDAAGNQP